MLLKHPLAIIGCVLFSLLLLIAVFYLNPWVSLNAERIASQLQSSGVIGYVAFLAVAGIATAIGLPRQLCAFIAGYAYGTVVALLLSSFAAIFGCALTFYFSRQFLSLQVVRRFPKAAPVLDAFLSQDALLKIIVLRLQPLGTNLLTNIAAGVSQIRASRFFLASWLGYLPQMLVFSLIGSGVRVSSGQRLGVSIGLLLLSLLLAWFVYRRYKLKQVN